MTMPLLTSTRYAILKELDSEYQMLHDYYYKVAPIGGRIPVGGGEWMDTFFKMEAIRGTQNALRNGVSIKEAVKQGKTTSEIAIELWNTKREWQIHRWKGECHSYLERLVLRCQNVATRGNQCRK